MSFVQPTNPDAILAGYRKDVARMEHLQNLMGLLGIGEWTVMHTWLEAQVEALKEGLCRRDLRKGEGTAIRAKIEALRGIIALPNAVRKEMSDIAERAKATHGKLQTIKERKPHTPGIGEAVAESEKLAQPTGDLR